METSTDKLEPIDVVYCGRTESADDKLAMILLPVALYRAAKNIDDATRSASLFTCKERELPRAIGTVYTIDGVVDADGRLVRIKGKPRFEPDRVLNVHVNAEYTAAWTARSEAVKVAIRARKIEADLAKDNQLRKLLWPLRQRYTETDRIGRLALEVVVLDTLRHS